MDLNTVLDDRKVLKRYWLWLSMDLDKWFYTKDKDSGFQRIGFIGFFTCDKDVGFQRIGHRFYIVTGNGFSWIGMAGLSVDIEFVLQWMDIGLSKILLASRDIQFFIGIRYRQFIGMDLTLRSSMSTQLKSNFLGAGAWRIRLKWVAAGLFSTIVLIGSDSSIKLTRISGQSKQVRVKLCIQC